jgi:hypothetical protein
MHRLLIVETNVKDSKMKVLTQDCLPLICKCAFPVCLLRPSSLANPFSCASEYLHVSTGQ